MLLRRGADELTFQGDNHCQSPWVYHGQLQTLNQQPEFVFLIAFDAGGLV
jgi:hypothetical protein